MHDLPFWWLCTGYINNICCLNFPDNPCGSPHVPINSNIQLPKMKERYRHHDTLALGCGTGYKKVGQALTKCENGTWTFSEFNCTSKDTCSNWNSYTAFRSLKQLPSTVESVSWFQNTWLPYKITSKLDGLFRVNNLILLHFTLPC